MKTFFTGDCHGDLVTGGFERHDESMGALETIADQAIKEQADLFVFLGDLTDPDVEESLAHRTIARSVAVHRKLEQHDIDDIWIVGNHDVMEDGRASHTLMALKNAGAQVVSEPTCFTHLKLAVLPYPSMTAKYDPAAFLRTMKGRFTMVAGHMTKIPLRGDGGSESTDMRRGRDMVFPIEECGDAWAINGHYHAGSSVGGVHTPGSPLICTHGEEENHPGYMVIDGRKIERREFEHYTRLVTYRMGDATARALVRDAIVRVIPAPDSTPEERRSLRELFIQNGGAKHVWFAPPSAGGQAVTRAAERAAKKEQAAGGSPREVVNRMVDEAATKDREQLRAVVSDALDGAGA